jgi:hypothetical protein
VSAARLWTWELPQSLLGLGLRLLLRIGGRERGAERRPDGRWLIENDNLGVSLGTYVYWPTGLRRHGPAACRLTRAHELGHTVQSRRLGWLYLPTVGLASVSRVAYSAVFSWRWGRAWRGYYDAWPEDAADRHGGVWRDAEGRRRPPPRGSPLDPGLDGA